MTYSGLYGTRPDLLPPEIRKLRLVETEEGRARRWVATEGFELLSYEVNLAVQRRFITAFPITKYWIDWARVEPDRFMRISPCQDVHGVAEPERLVGKWLEDFFTGFEYLYFLFENGYLPAIRAERDAVQRHLPVLIQIDPTYWICSDAHDQVLEVNLDGEAHLARVDSSS